MSDIIRKSITETNFEPGKNLGKKHRLAKAQMLNERRANAHLMKNEDGDWLRNLLLGCVGYDPCRNAICAPCINAAQDNMRNPLWEYALLSWPTIKVVSIVDSRDKVAPGELHTFDLENYKRRMKARLHGAGIESAVLGFDISYNEHENDRYDAHWQPHLFGLVTTDNPKRIKEQFEATDETPRPVKIQDWDKRPDVSRYMLKASFSRRVGLDDVQGTNHRTGEPRLFRDVSYQRLRAAEEHELLQFLFGTKIDDRYIFIGCQLRISGGRLTIIKSK